MKTRTHRAVCPQEYLEAFGLNPDRVIYFDIETTGFRASTSSLYMIGWAVKDAAVPLAWKHAAVHSALKHAADEGAAEHDSGWTVTQIMAESSAEERSLLEQFLMVLRSYDTILAFNGNRFDLPYLREKCEMHGLEDPFARCSPLDLYHEIRPYRHALGLARLNQKSVEQFLQISREDPYNGGELIEVYRSVRNHRCPDRNAAIDALFLHNYEDVLGMLSLTKLLAYPLAAQANSPVTFHGSSEDCAQHLEDMPEREDKPESRDKDTVPGANTQLDAAPDPEAAPGMRVIPALEAQYRLKVPFPRPLMLAYTEQCTLFLSGDSVTLEIRPLTGCLYHFFPDYRNYYYLPEEDTAIHKSVAAFVDPSHREKAKAQNCYIKKEGSFLPQADASDASIHPVFKRSYHDSVFWFEYSAQMKADPSILSEYVHLLVRNLLLHGSETSSASETNSVSETSSISDETRI